MDSELDDLDGLVNFFAGAAGDAAAEQAQNVVVGPLQQQEQDDGDDVPDDLLQMVEIAADVPRRAHERRSWQLLQHARSCKQKKRLHGQVAQREKRAKRAESQLAIVAALHPSIGRALGCPSIAVVDAEQMAELHVRLACTPRPKGRHVGHERLGHLKITRGVAEFFEHCQSELVQRLSIPPRHSDPSAEPVLSRLFGLSVQWDGTSQKLKPLWKALSTGTKQPQMKTSGEVMMASGNFHLSYSQGSHENPTWHRMLEPWRVKPTRLESTSANFLLEFLLEVLPIDFRDVSNIEYIGAVNDAFVFTVTIDRASSNLSLCRWFCGWLEIEVNGVIIIFHVELCNLHGVSLVKNRATDQKTIAAALFSYTRWLRGSKNNALLVDGVMARLHDHVEMRNEQRPANARNESLELIRLIYGSFSASFFWRKCKRTKTMVKSQLLLALERLCDMVDLQATSTTICFWNVVSPGSHWHEVHNKPIGSVIFQDKKECGEAVGSAVVNVIAQRAWVDAALSRWTNVSTTSRRFLVGCLAGRVLPTTLDDIKVGLALSDDLEAILAKLIKADVSDYATKNKLRLIRFCKVLTKPDITWRLAVMVLAGSPVEELQYDLLGHARKKASLISLIHPKTSPIITAQNKLYRMARNFDIAEGSPWILLHKVGAHLEDLEVKLVVRRTILQLSVGLEQLFALRMNQGIYRLGWMVFSDIARNIIVDMLTTFFASPRECQSFAAVQLAKLYPTVAAMLKHGPAVLRTILEVTPTSIDFSERSHNQLRQDISSQGPASSLAAAADRLLCKQFAAEHISRGGDDPVLIPIVSYGKDEGKDNSSSSNSRRGLGGSAYQEFRNSRMCVFKAMIAPDRALDEHERQQCTDSIREEWARVKDNPLEYNLWLHASNHKSRPPLLNSSSDQHNEQRLSPSGSTDQGFRNLWSEAGSRKHLVDPKAFLEFQASKKRSGKYTGPAKVRVVSSPVPDRISERHPFTGSLHGCGCSVKNVCRVHGMPGGDVDRLNSLCQRFARWVDGLPTASRFDCCSLLWSEGSASPDEEPTVAFACLLVHPVGSPKAQFFMRCGLLEGGADPLSAFPPSPLFPVLLRIMHVASRMAFADSEDADDFQFWIMTSDELGQAMMRARTHWNLFQPEHEIALGATLLDILVTDKGKKVEVPGQAPRANTAYPTTLPAELDMGDPLHYDGERHSASSAPACSAAPAEGLHDVDDVDLESNSDQGEAPPAEFAEDVYEGMAEEYQLPPCEQDQDFGGVVDGVVDMPPGEVEEIVHEVIHEPVPPDEDHEPSMDELIASARIDAHGYVTTDVMPWAAKGLLGRITVWPNKPGIQPSRQNIAARCYMHASCSYSRKRDRVSDQQILRWLFSARPLEHPSPEQRAEAKAAHRRLASEILVDVAPPDASTAAGSDALAP